MVRGFSRSITVGIIIAVLTVLQWTTVVAAKGPNDTNKEIEKITSLATRNNTTLSIPSQLVLYQIAIQIDDKGGNMTKAIHRIDSAITQNPMAVSLEHLPIVETLLHLAQIKAAGKVSTLNEIIDNATTQALNGNENKIDSLLIRQTEMHRS